MTKGKRMKKLLIVSLLLSCLSASCGPVKVIGSTKPKTVPKAKIKPVKPLALINVYPSAFRSCNAWCRGQCKAIQIDPNQGHLWRYLCHGDKKWWPRLNLQQNWSTCSTTRNAATSYYSTSYWQLQYLATHYTLWLIFKCFMLSLID